MSTNYWHERVFLNVEQPETTTEEQGCLDTNGLESTKLIKDEWITTTDKSVSPNSLRPLNAFGRNGQEVFSSFSKSLIITVKLSEEADVSIGSFQVISKNSNVKSFMLMSKKHGEKTFKPFGKVITFLSVVSFSKQ